MTHLERFLSIIGFVVVWFAVGMTFLRRQGADWDEAFVWPLMGLGGVFIVAVAGFALWSVT